MKLDAGHLVLLPFPHTNLKAGKKRPALVLTDATYNEASRDVVLAYVTSQPQSGPWTVPVAGQDLASGSLALDSWVRVDRLATVDKKLVLRAVARLNAKTLRQVRAQLSELLGT